MTVPHEGMIQALVADLAMRLAQGHAVAVHCRAGIGRSGGVTCCLLCHFGQSGDDAIAAVSAARGIPVPDTPEQADFIRRFAQARRA